MTDLLQSPISRVSTAEATWLSWTSAIDQKNRQSPLDEADIGDDWHHNRPGNRISTIDVEAQDTVPFASLGAELHVDTNIRRQADEFYHLSNTATKSDSDPPHDKHLTDTSKPAACRYPILDDSDAFEPVDDLRSLASLPPLDYKPLILQKWTLIIICIFYLGLIAGLSVLYWFQNNARIFHIRATASHFTIRILPSLIGTISTLLFQSVATNLDRIVPYINMASSPPNRRGSSTLLARYFPLFDFVQAFGNKHYHLVFLFAVGFYLNGVVTPLKSTLIHRKVSEDDPDLWTISITSFSALILLFIYSILFAIVMSISIYLWGRRTGLKWDPVSIADHLTLLQGSDVLEDFVGLEYGRISGSDMVRNLARFNHLRNKQYRLGYWRHKPTNQIWHGIRKWPISSIQTPLNRESKDNTHDAPSLRDQSSFARTWWAEKYAEVCRKPHLCYYGLYLWISDIPAIFVYTIVGLFAAAGLFFILTDRLNTGFTYPTQNIHVTGFVLNFIPSFTIQFINLYWNQIDIWYRQLQPFMGMRNPSPATENLLLGYSCDLPVVITMKALANQHWRLAFTSIMPLVQKMLPILVGSCFSITSITPDNFHIGVAALPFKAATGLLLSYLILIPVAWPGLNRRLPVLPQCIANLWVLFYDSTLIRKDAFLPRRVDEQRWHMEYRLCLEERRYGFGVYRGRYGAIHIGIDDVYGHSSDEMGFRFVAPLKPPRRWYRRWLRSVWGWMSKKLKIKRQPTLLPEEFEAQERLHSELTRDVTSEGADKSPTASEIELLERNEDHGEIRERYRHDQSGRLSV